MKNIRILILAFLLIPLTGCSQLNNAAPAPENRVLATATLPAAPTIRTFVPGTFVPTVTRPTLAEVLPPIGTAQVPMAVPSAHAPDAVSTLEDQYGVPTPTIDSHEAPTATMIAQLQATVMAGIRPTITPDSTGMTPFGGIDQVSVTHLTPTTLKGDYWLVYSTGSRMFDNPSQQHFAAIYDREKDVWHQVSRIELESPYYLSDGSAMQVNIEPTHIWISVESGVGAHGGCFDLLSFDGKTLTDQESNCASDPAAGTVEDLDGDGNGELVLNANDDYVFCYACGVRLISYKVMRWSGSSIVEITPQKLTNSTSVTLKENNDRAVDYFTHSLVKDAQASIEKAYSIDPKNETVKWNRILINLQAEARKEAASNGDYPLLTNIFYGDYAAALNVLRPYTIDQILSAPETSPLLVGTSAEGDTEALASYITSTTTLAIEANPELAGAYYLRAWALHLVGGHDSEVIADVEKAVSLDPTESLFADTLARIKP